MAIKKTSCNDTEKKQTVVFVATRSFAIVSFCQFLIPHFLSKNWRVVIASSVDDYAEQLAASGAIIENVSFLRGKFSPFRDLRSLLQLIKIFKKYKPCLVHHFHPRPIILGNLASRFVKHTQVVNTVSGVGYAFSQNGITRHLAELGYRFTLSRSQAIIFVNHADKELFLRKGWCTEDIAHLVISHGVDTGHFHPNTQHHNDVIVLMVSRLLWQKGVREFVNAAEALKRQFPDVRFQLGGEWDLEHPDAVEKPWIKNAVNDGTIEFVGYVSNMGQYLQKIDVFILPSFYREGLPRVLLEAAACGIPVITTDMPGCREAVINNKTGFLVPPQDIKALTEAIYKLLIDVSLRRQMGKQSREFVEQNFDKRLITQKYLNIYQGLGLEV